MASSEVEKEISAEAAGRIYYSISRLLPEVRGLLPLKDFHRLDFNQSLRALNNIRNSLKLNVDKSGNALKKLVDRAIVTRNKFSHHDQSIDLGDFQHYIETIASVAAAIGKEDVRKKILEEISRFNKIKETILQNDLNRNVVWIQLLEEGVKCYEDEQWTDAMNCFTGAIHLNPERYFYSTLFYCTYLNLKLSDFL